MNRIRELRMERKMSLTVLAKLAGVSVPFMFDLEHGNRGAKKSTLERIAVALGVTVEDLKETA